MGMPGDYQPCACIKQRRDVGHVMDQQSLPAIEIETQMVSEVFCPRERQVIIPAHDMQRRNRRQLFEDLRFTDVAGMNDSFTALQRRKGFGAEQAVGIGDHANFHARLQAGFKNERRILIPVFPYSDVCVFRDQVLDSPRHTRNCADVHQQYLRLT
jgi:hypothetical protein